MPTKSTRSHGSGLGNQRTSRGRRGGRGSDRRRREAVSSRLALNGHTRGRDTSSPEDAGSRY
jgi:hypothetical protein